MTGAIDLSPAHLAIVERILAEHVPECEVRAFGSRATWTARDYSDLDLAVVGDGPLHWRTLSRLREAFEESRLPMRVDVLDWHDIPQSFQEVIQRDYVVLQEAEGAGKRTTLGDVAHIVTGQSPPGGTVSPDKGLPLLNGPTEFGPHHPTPAQFTTDARKKAKPGDVLFCVRGSTTGRMNWADREYAIGRGVAAIRHCQGHDLQPMLRGVIEHHLPDLLAQATGSTFPNVSGQQLAAIPYPDIGVDEQRAIAHVLGTLDDKIELNRRMNETLEAMARALFRSWFVDFEPVRAKMEGRWRPGESLPGLPAHLHPLFPDRLVPSELGDIPEGWGLRPLGDVIEVARGLSYKGAGLSSDGVPMHNLNSIYEGGGYKYEGIKHYAGDYQPRHLVRSGEVIVANTEQGHDRLLIGYAAVVPHTAVDQGLFSHHLYRVRPRDTSALPPAFVCALLNTPTMHGVVSGYANGTTVNMLPLDALRLPLITVPPQSLTRLFGALAAATRNRREQLTEQSRVLASLRDVLLPRLVSGEVRVETT